MGDSENRGTPFWGDSMNTDYTDSPILGGIIKGTPLFWEICPLKTLSKSKNHLFPQPGARPAAASASPAALPSGGGLGFRV